MKTLITSFLLCCLSVTLASTCSRTGQGKRIYDPEAKAEDLIKTAQKAAKKSKRNVILVFGADWCGDCRALDKYMSNRPLKDFIDEHFVVAHIDVADFSKNTEVAAKFALKVKKGIPALVVMTPDEVVLEATNGFSNARRMTSESVQYFLADYTPTGK